jgi:hypothetical protein
MHIKQATPPTSNAAFHTSASNPATAEPWKITVLVRVLEEQVAALNCADQEGHVAMSPIRAVWFDVGEVLINETREYGTWADWRSSAQSSPAARTTVRCSSRRLHRDPRARARGDPRAHRLCATDRQRRPTYPLAKQVHILVHEIGHVRCDHEGRDIPRSQRKTEAESVAFVVCSVLNFAVGDVSSVYIGGWSGRLRGDPGCAGSHSEGRPIDPRRRGGVTWRVIPVSSGGHTDVPPAGGRGRCSGSSRHEDREVGQGRSGRC